MTDKINVQKIAELAMLKLNNNETEQLQKQFEQILGYFEKISSITIDENHTDSANDNLVIYRDDKTVASEVSVSKDNFSENIENNCFTVPKVID